MASELESESEISVSVTDTEAITSNDDGTSVKKKKKKKHRRKKKKNRESETSDDEGGEKKKRKKKKKKKRKKKKKDEYESGTGGSSKEDEKEDKGLKPGGGSTTDISSDGPQITKRAPRKINRSGMKTDPSEWSTQDLMDKLKKFAAFKTDRKTGASSLIIEEKKILDDSMKVLNELFNRNTEIQSITFARCFLVDDMFVEIMKNGIMRQRYVKNMVFSGNALTNKSMRLILEYFANREERPLESIDVRDNILNAHDIREMYEALPQLKVFNGINLIESKGKIDLDLSGKKLKVTEVSIICCLSRESPIIKRLNLNMNYIDSDSLHVLADLIDHTEDISGIKLAFNPLSNNGEDHSGSIAIRDAMHRRTQIVDLDLTGGKVRPDIEECILRSVMVNRSVKGQRDSSRFKNFLDKRLLDVAPEKPQFHLDGWMPSLKVDPAFLYSRQNAARNRQVEVRNDQIILPRR